MAKIRRSIRPLLVGLSLAAAGGLASGHTYVLPLGEAAGATHYFGVICSSDGGYDTDHLLLHLETHGAGTALVSAQVVKGSAAVSTTDPVNGDARPSPTVRLRGGNGQYQVLINKTGAGALSFTVTAHCLDVSGTQHTGTDAVVYQFQDR
jgi:hypothetical protein